MVPFFLFQFKGIWIPIFFFGEPIWIPICIFIFLLCRENKVNSCYIHPYIHKKLLQIHDGVLSKDVICELHLNFKSFLFLMTIFFKASQNRFDI